MKNNHRKNLVFTFLPLVLLFACASVALAQITTLHINEVESNGGVPDDWIEFTNSGTSTIDISGWKVLDNDNATHAFYVFPTGSTIPPKGFLVVDIAPFFGLGSADSVRLYDPSVTIEAARGGVTPYEMYSWTSHATTTYGRCPDGTGDFVTTTSSTKGTANDCGAALGINEVKLSGAAHAAWVELFNHADTASSVAGYVLKDSNDTHSYPIPAGTSIPSHGYLALDQSAFGFELDSSDSVRLFDTTAKLVDSFTWTRDTPTTYGRCPDGFTIFIFTAAPTKGAANNCPLWPGGAAVDTVDGMSVFGGNLSGLIYEKGSPDVLWGIRNGPSTIFRLIFNGSIWTPDPGNGWGAGKTIVYPNGTGGPDSEGITFPVSSSNGLYVSTERDNNVNTISHISVLRFDPSAPGTTLIATNEWNLTADLPVSGPNLGAEAIAYVPDTFLTAKNFFDESKGHTYNPAEYANHGTGLFFVGLESNGKVYAYALDHSPGGNFTKIATISTDFPSVMDLNFDSLLGDLWAVCDDTCQGLHDVLRIDSNGKYVVAAAFQRPAGMPNFNNEGFAISPASLCVGNSRPVFWSDDSEDNGHAIRRGTLPCTNFVASPGSTDISTVITNPQFAGNAGSCPVSWICSGSPDPGFSSYAPTSAQYPGGSPFAQAAFSPTIYGGSGVIRQLTNLTWVPGASYTFPLWAGLPLKEPDGTTPVAGWPALNGAVRLYLTMGDGFGQVAAFDIPSPSPGTFAKNQIDFTLPANSGAVGQKIGIMIYVSAPSGYSANFVITPSFSSAP
jgi:hypothetical protein